MKNKMTIDFVKEFIWKIFCGEVPEGVYISLNEDAVYFCVDNFLYEMDSRGEFQGHEWYTRTGCSKIVFIFEDYDEVIKIGFKGEVEIGENVDTQDGILQITEYDYEDRDNRVILSSYSVNYLNEEIEIYNERINEKTRQFLLENRIVYYIGDIEIALQDKVAFTHCENPNNEYGTEAWETLSDKSPKIRDFVMSSCDAVDLPSIFLAKIYDTFEGNVPFEVIKDLENMTDLHNNNIGYIYKNKVPFPVILDYAGFDD